ncbi:MAG: hypothetical protein AMXMBFR7_48240 [Planctomycetota bacterium]
MRASRTPAPLFRLLHLFVCLTLCATATSHAGEEAAPAAGRDEYRVQPGDVLTLWVYRQPDLNVEMTVSPRGVLRVPLLGAVETAGRSLDTLTQEIAKGLKEKAHLLEANVTLAVKSYAQRQAYVHGAVYLPKAVDLPNDRPLTVSQSLALTGGLRPEAQATEIRVTRQPREGPAQQLRVNLERIAAGGHVEEDLALQSGDVVFVPEEMGIFVIGGVKKPGYFVRNIYRQDRPSGTLTASQALAMAEGLAPGGRAAEARVIRRVVSGEKPEVVSVDLFKLLASVRPEDDVTMAPGDTLLVPQSEGVYVLGDVQEGGVFYPPAGGKLTVTRALALAKGFEKFAKRSDVRVVRRSGVTLIDVDKLTEKAGSLEGDIELEPGDVVFVPKGF